MNKTCSKCKEEKDLSEFNIDKTRKFGVTCACKKCRHPTIKIPKTGFKFCTECLEEKENKLFSKCSINSTGLTSSCKDCQKEKRTNKVQEKVLNTSGFKVCTTCLIEQPISMFYKNNNTKDLLNSGCKSCKKEYYKRESEQILERRKLNYKENYPKIKERHKYLESINVQKQKIIEERFCKEQENKKLKRIRIKVKNLISSSFKRACKGGYKKSVRTEDILGCNPLIFKEYIESQFLPWMSWSNHGNACETLDYNCSWDFDHIVPVSWAQTEEDVYLLNHWSNIQPLCSYVNRHIKKDNIYPVTNLELKITIIK